MSKEFLTASFDITYLPLQDRKMDVVREEAKVVITQTLTRACAPAQTHTHTHTHTHARTHA